MKRHGFKGLGAGHGVQRKHRSPGSIGACATPGRVFKGTADGRPHGRRPHDHAEPHGPRGRRRAAACCSSRARSPAPTAASSSSAPPPREPGKVMPPSEPPTTTSPSTSRDAATARTTGTVELPAEVFDVAGQHPADPPGRRGQLAAARQGTHTTKTRGEVRGGGRKPYRQKGTGRARQGSTRAPQFAGGGVVHGPQPRDYAQRTPKKMKAAALRGALSDRARNGRVHVVSALVDGDAPVDQGRGRRRCATISRAPARARRGRARRRADAGRACATSPTVHLLAPGPAQHLRRAGQRRRGLHRGGARGVPRRPGRAASRAEGASPAPPRPHRGRRQTAASSRPTTERRAPSSMSR